jgi:effector-binding domain-containing protein
MFKKILLVLVALVLVAVVGGLLLPSKVVVERTVVINRPASMVFATVNSFQLFPKWSPWQDLDPNMHQSTDGPRDGVGAKLVWSGNDKVGNGSDTITAFDADRSVDTDIDFGKMGTAKARMLLASEGNATRTTWRLTMDMGANPIAHYFGLTMDRMVGPDFATGLAKLKRLVEAMPDQDIAGLTVVPVELGPQPILLVSETTPLDGVSKGYIDAFTRIAKFMAKNKLKQAGAPLGIEGAMTATSYGFDAGIPVDRGDSVGIDGVKVDKSYTGKALKTVHSGSYQNLNATRDKLLAFAAAHGYARSGAVFYSFIDDPGKIPEPQVRTEVFAPVE